MQTHFPKPQAPKLLIAVNRVILEKEVANSDRENQVAVEKLAIFKVASVEGLWDGRAKVVEAGMSSDKNTRIEA